MSAPLCLLVSAMTSSAQELEFREARFIGRVDYPYLIQNWRFSDFNGNRRLDASESLDSSSATQYADEPPHDLAPIDQVVPEMGREIDDGREFPETYGQVLINFDDPQQLMLGWLDVWTTPSGGGPFTPDGIPDDVDRDGHHGPSFDLEDPAWVPETRIIGAGLDFDDVVLLPPTFMDVAEESQFRAGNVQFVHVLSFATPRAEEGPLPETFDVLDISYGANFSAIPTAYDVRAYGGVLGDSEWLTSLDNRTMGVQAGAVWTRRWRMLELQGVASASLNYNLIEAEQSVSIGEDLVPGQYNRPLYFPSSNATHTLKKDDFSPQAELGVRGSVYLSHSLQVFLGFDWLALYDIHFAKNAVVYELPSMGLIDAGGEKLEGYLTSVGIHWQR
jgi:hypothetical protein